MVDDVFDSLNYCKELTDVYGLITKIGIEECFTSF